jgi:hypothetical protein
MSPENVMNFGQNWGVWVIAGVLWAAGLVLARIVLSSLKLWSSFAKEKDEEAARKAFKKFVLWTVFMVALFLTGLFIVFLGHGSAAPPQLPEAEEDGFNGLVEEMPDETPESKDKTNPVSPVLDQVREHAKADGGEDEYIKKAVERSKKMLGE